MYKIGEFSKMSKTTVKTLRYYDETGLLKPEKTDPFTKYRMYTSSQLEKLHTIQALRQINLSVDDIKEILSEGETKEILKRHKDRLDEELSAVKERISCTEFILSGKDEESIMNYHATIKEIPECTVYCKKMTVPDYDAYFDIIPGIGSRVTTKYPDLKCAVPEYCYITYLDGEYREKDINIEFCEAVDGMRENFEDIEFKKTQPVKVVSVMHKGPYSTISKAYAYAFRWIEENNFKASGNPRESYIDGIWNKEEETGWLTELQIPVEKI